MFGSGLRCRRPGGTRVTLAIVALAAAMALAAPASASEAGPTPAPPASTPSEQPNETPSPTPEPSPSPSPEPTPTPEPTPAPTPTPTPQPSPSPTPPPATAPPATPPGSAAPGPVAASPGTVAASAPAATPTPRAPLKPLSATTIAPIGLDAAKTQAAAAAAALRRAETALTEARARHEASVARARDLRERADEAIEAAELAAGAHAAAAQRRDPVWPSLPSVMDEADDDLLTGLTGLAQVGRLMDDPSALGEVAAELAEVADLAEARAAEAEAGAPAQLIAKHEAELATAKTAAGRADAALAAAIGGTPIAPVLMIDGEWTHPLPGSVETDGFGLRSDRPHPDVNEMHRGTDLAAACATPIRAASHGTVVEAGPSGTYGNWVLIQHAGTLSTGYAHLDSIGVEAGEVVRAGQVIGTVGSTGASTGCHLHFEVRNNGIAEDAEPFMARRGIRLGRG